MLNDNLLNKDYYNLDNFHKDLQNNSFSSPSTSIVYKSKLVAKSNELDNAAISIQTLIRSYIYRQYFLKSTKIKEKIESQSIIFRVVKSYLSQYTLVSENSKYLQLLRHNAATTINRFVRGFLSRKKISRLVDTRKWAGIDHVSLVVRYLHFRAYMNALLMKDYCEKETKASALHAENDKISSDTHLKPLVNLYPTCIDLPILPLPKNTTQLPIVWQAKPPLRLSSMILKNDNDISVQLRDIKHKHCIGNDTFAFLFSKNRKQWTISAFNEQKNLLALKRDKMIRSRYYNFDFAFDLSEGEHIFIKDEHSSIDFMENNDFHMIRTTPFNHKEGNSFLVNNKINDLDSLRTPDKHGRHTQILNSPTSKSSDEKDCDNESFLHTSSSSCVILQGLDCLRDSAEMLKRHPLKADLPQARSVQKGKHHQHETSFSDVNKLYKLKDDHLIKCQDLPTRILTQNNSKIEIPNNFVNDCLDTNSVLISKAVSSSISPVINESSLTHGLVANTKNYVSKDLLPNNKSIINKDELIKGRHPSSEDATEITGLIDMATASVVSKRSAALFTPESPTFSRLFSSSRSRSFYKEKSNRSKRKKFKFPVSYPHYTKAPPPPDDCLVIAAPRRILLNASNNSLILDKTKKSHHGSLVKLNSANHNNQPEGQYSFYDTNIDLHRNITVKPNIMLKSKIEVDEIENIINPQHDWEPDLTSSKSTTMPSPFNMMSVRERSLNTAIPQQAIYPQHPARAHSASNKSNYQTTSYLVLDKQAHRFPSDETIASSVGLNSDVYDSVVATEKKFHINDVPTAVNHSLSSQIKQNPVSFIGNAQHVHQSKLPISPTSISDTARQLDSALHPKPLSSPTASEIKLNTMSYELVTTPALGYSNANEFKLNQPGVFDIASSSSPSLEIEGFTHSSSNDLPNISTGLVTNISSRSAVDKSLIQSSPVKLDDTSLLKGFTFAALHTQSNIATPANTLNDKSQALKFKDKNTEKLLNDQLISQNIGISLKHQFPYKEQHAAELSPLSINELTPHQFRSDRDIFALDRYHLSQTSPTVIHHLNNVFHNNSNDDVKYATIPFDHSASKFGGTLANNVIPSTSLTIDKVENFDQTIDQIKATKESIEPVKPVLNAEPLNSPHISTTEGILDKKGTHDTYITEHSSQYNLKHATFNNNPKHVHPNEMVAPNSMSGRVSLNSLINFTKDPTDVSNTDQVLQALSNSSLKTDFSAAETKNKRKSSLSKLFLKSEGHNDNYISENASINSLFNVISNEASTSNKQVGEKIKLSNDSLDSPLGPETSESLTTPTSTSHKIHQATTAIPINISMIDMKLVRRQQNNGRVSIAVTDLPSPVNESRKEFDFTCLEFRKPYEMDNNEFEDNTKSSSQAETTLIDSKSLKISTSDVLNANQIIKVPANNNVLVISSDPLNKIDSQTPSSIPNIIQQQMNSNVSPVGRVNDNIIMLPSFQINRLPSEGAAGSRNSAALSPLPHLHQVDNPESQNQTFNRKNELLFSPLSFSSRISSLTTTESSASSPSPFLMSPNRLKIVPFSFNIEEGDGKGNITANESKITKIQGIHMNRNSFGLRENAIPNELSLSTSDNPGLLEQLKMELSLETPAHADEEFIFEEVEISDSENIDSSPSSTQKGIDNGVKEKRRKTVTIRRRRGSYEDVMAIRLQEMADAVRASASATMWSTTGFDNFNQTVDEVNLKSALNGERGIEERLQQQSGEEVKTDKHEIFTEISVSQISNEVESKLKSSFNTSSSFSNSNNNADDKNEEGNFNTQMGLMLRRASLSIQQNRKRRRSFMESLQFSVGGGSTTVEQSALMSVGLMNVQPIDNSGGNSFKSDESSSQTSNYSPTTLSNSTKRFNSSSRRKLATSEANSSLNSPSPPPNETIHREAHSPIATFSHSPRIVVNQSNTSMNSREITEVSANGQGVTFLAPLKHFNSASYFGETGEIYLQQELRSQFSSSEPDNNLNKGLNSPRKENTNKNMDLLSVFPDASNMCHNNETHQSGNTTNFLDKNSDTKIISKYPNDRNFKNQIPDNLKHSECSGSKAMSFTAPNISLLTFHDSHSQENPGKFSTTINFGNENPQSGSLNRNTTNRNSHAFSSKTSDDISNISYESSSDNLQKTGGTEFYAMDLKTTTFNNNPQKNHFSLPRSSIRSSIPPEMVADLEKSMYAKDDPSPMSASNNAAAAQVIKVLSATTATEGMKKFQQLVKKSTINAALQQYAGPSATNGKDVQYPTINFENRSDSSSAGNENGYRDSSFSSQISKNDEDDGGGANGSVTNSILLRNSNSTDILCSECHRTNCDTPNNHIQSKTDQFQSQIPLVKTKTFVSNSQINNGYQNASSQLPPPIYRKTNPKIIIGSYNDENVMPFNTEISSIQESPTQYHSDQFPVQNGIGQKNAVYFIEERAVASEYPLKDNDEAESSATQENIDESVISIFSVNDNVHNDSLRTSEHEDPEKTKIQLPSSAVHYSPTTHLSKLTREEVTVGQAIFEKEKKCSQTSPTLLNKHVMRPFSPPRSVDQLNAFRSHPNPWFNTRPASSLSNRNQNPAPIRTLISAEGINNRQYILPPQNIETTPKLITQNKNEMQNSKASSSQNRNFQSFSRGKSLQFLSETPRQPELSPSRSPPPQTPPGWVGDSTSVSSKTWNKSHEKTTTKSQRGLSIPGRPSSASFLLGSSTGHDFNSASSSKNNQLYKMSLPLLITKDRTFIDADHMNPRHLEEIISAEKAMIHRNIIGQFDFQPLCKKNYSTASTSALFATSALLSVQRNGLSTPSVHNKQRINATPTAQLSPSSNLNSARKKLFPHVEHPEIVNTPSSSNEKVEQQLLSVRKSSPPPRGGSVSRSPGSFPRSMSSSKLNNNSSLFNSQDPGSRMTSPSRTKTFDTFFASRTIENQKDRLRRLFSEPT